MKKFILFLPVFLLLFNGCPKCPDNSAVKLGHPNNGATTIIQPAGVVGGNLNPIIVSVNPPGQAPTQGNPVEIFLYSANPANTQFMIMRDPASTSTLAPPYPQPITIPAGPPNTYSRAILMPDPTVPNNPVQYMIISQTFGAGNPPQFNAVTSGPNPASTNNNYQTTTFYVSANPAMQATVIVGDQAIFQ
jgi:hypothetical protein